VYLYNFEAQLLDPLKEPRTGLPGRRPNGAAPSCRLPRV